MIEYVLMLVITVSLLLALITQIFRPLNDFLKSYMGDYVACLLETGELPSLGSDETNATEECNAKFQNASFTAGRPPSTPGSGSGAATTNPPSSSTSSPADGSSSGSSGGGTYAGSSSRGGGRAFRPPNRGPTGLDGGSSQSKEKTVEIALEGGGSGSFFAGSNGGTYTRPARKTRSVGLAGLSEADRKKLERKEITGRQTLVPAEGFSAPQKKTAVKPPPEKELKAEEDESFTIGNFIRYLFIAAIIIALVIFIGGQALQMSKSFEK